jgi:hypothetical protein
VLPGRHWPDTLPCLGPASELENNFPFANVAFLHQGSMLGSQFSAIFGEKIGVFLKNQCYDQFFKYLAFLSQKRQFFR